jgi:hypothetical protein
MAKGNLKQTGALQHNPNGTVTVPTTTRGRFADAWAQAGIKVRQAGGRLGHPLLGFFVQGRNGNGKPLLGFAVHGKNAALGDFAVVEGPTGKSFARASNGSLWTPVTQRDNVKYYQLPPALEPGTAITPGLVKGPTGLQFYRDGKGSLYLPLNMKRDGLTTNDLPPVLEPTSTTE